MSWQWFSKIIFFLGLALAASGLFSPPVALFAGLLFGLTLTHPFLAESRSATKYLLQVSVVALGFGMNLHEIVRAGRSGVLYTALGIAATVLLGIYLGRAIAVSRKVSFLITVGTAICG